MSYRRDLDGGQNPHINFEPSIHNGLSESEREEPNNPPEIRGRLVRSVLERRNDYYQPRALLHDDGMGAGRSRPQHGHTARSVRTRRSGADAVAFLPDPGRLWRTGR